MKTRPLAVRQKAMPEAVPGSLPSSTQAMIGAGSLLGPQETYRVFELRALPASLLCVLQQCAMIALLNFGVMIAASFLFSFFYVRSVSPAAREKKLGEVAYEKSARDRTISSFFMLVVAADYALYYWFPLPLPIPRTFPWDWNVSAAIAVLIAIPSAYLMYRGIKDAGEETMRPKKEHRMYGGIYEKIRHPQAVGELPFWWVIAFLVHSPFLVLFSFVYVPVWYSWCRAEERDLVLRYGAAYREYMDRVGFWFPKRPGGSRRA